MNLDYLLKKIRPFVVDNQLTYDDFDSQPSTCLFTVA